MDKVEMDKIESLKDRLLLAEKYNDTNALTDLLFNIIESVVPGVTAVKQYANEKVNKNQSKKIEELSKIILDEPKLITIEKISDIRFIMEFARTVDVIKRLSQNEKVLYIARLFKKSFVEIDEYDIDLYEEFLHRLDYLSLREINLLIGLYQYSKMHEEKYHKEWYAFKSIAARELSLTEEDIASIFNGLCMTGFCAVSNVLFPSDGTVENPIYTTKYLEKFLNMIL